MKRFAAILGALLPLGPDQAIRAPLHRAARAAADDDGRHADAGDAGASRRFSSGWPAARRHIVVGPWLSEVGFELLYWIPFLNWVKTYRPFDPERMVVVSRGGAGIWYHEHHAELHRPVRLLHAGAVPDEERAIGCARTSRSTSR